MLQLRALNIDLLDRYAKRIGRYNARYPGCWLLICQADVRARLELFERVRRKGEMEASKAAQEGRGHAFDKDKPWLWVMDQVIEHPTFWREELEDPCTLVLAKAAAMTNMVSGDAPITTQVNRGETSDPCKTRPDHWGNLIGPRQIHGGCNQLRRPKVTSSKMMGRCTHNRRGTALCIDHQKPEGCPRGNDCWYAHQCEKCLQTSCTPHQCTKTPKVSASVSRPTNKG